MTQNSLKLYSYYRSSASYRVRIALHWKELEFEYVPVHLIRAGGEQHTETYRKLNPMGHVPTLVHNEFVLSESVAIIDYLDQVFPQKKLFPVEPQKRAKVLQIAETINSGIQPYQNQKLLVDFEKSYGWDQNKKTEFMQKWVKRGLQSLEKILETTAGSFAFGGEITAADAFLVPQCFSAMRFGIELTQFPNLWRVFQNADRLPAFQKAHPKQQPDFEP